MDYKNRNGELINANDKQDKFLEGMFSTISGRFLLKTFSHPMVSRIVGRLLSSSISCCKIDSFIKKNNIDMSDYVPCRYKSYNDFFTRKIRYDRRPIDYTKESLISPSDGKLTVYNINLKSKVKIKNSIYTVESLLQNTKLAESFIGGYMAIVRLTVDNYHRYCYIDNGIKSDNIAIPGVLYTVNPAALEHVKIYKENSREYTVILTENFGKMVQMEVGATLVGKIKNRHNKGRIRKGQEKGYFEFGGSTIVMLFQRDQVVFDDDIIKNSAEGYETIVKMGEKIGTTVF